LGLDVITIFIALPGKHSTGILPGGDYTCGRQFGAAVLLDPAFDEQVARLSSLAMLSAKIVILDDAGEHPSVALGIAFVGACELGAPIAVETLALPPK
jgi:hypothetical protein